MFAVIRHPDVEALGIVAEEALDLHRAKGWVRVSEWAPTPSDLSLAAYADTHDDLDAQPEPATDEPDVPAETTEGIES